MTKLYGYLVKFYHNPTKENITLFVESHDLGQGYDLAKNTLTAIMQREDKGVGSPAEIADKPNDPQVMKRWEVVSVSHVEVEVQ